MRKFLALTKVAFKDIVSNKAYYVLILFAFALLFVSVFASYLTVSTPDRVVLDFGISIVRFVSICLAVWIAANHIALDVEKRTIQIVLTKPISRVQYFLSKSISLFAVLFVAIVFLFLLFLFVYRQSEGVFHVNLIYAFVGIFYQSVLTGVFTLIFSIYFSKIFSSLLGFSFALLGLTSNEFHSLKEQVDSGVLKGVFQFLVVSFPNLEHFHLEFFALYQKQISSEYFISFNLYFLIWFGLLVLGGSLLMNKKEF